MRHLWGLVLGFLGRKAWEWVSEMEQVEVRSKQR